MVSRAQRHTGFTLIEILVAMAIIAILAAIAIPAYSEHVKRGMIPEATNALADARVKAEQHLQDSASHDFTGFTYTQGSEHFSLACALGAADANGKIVGYTCTATGSGMMGGFAYTIDQSGAKTTKTVPSGWTLPSPNNCWAIRSNGKC